VIAVAAILCATLSFIRARRLLRGSRRAAARVVELGPAEFGAQNFSMVLERNGLRKHLMRVEGGEDAELVAVWSYWWREPGVDADVVFVERKRRYRFASDIYAAPATFAAVALLAAVTSIMLWLGPARF
jgi:hypothetical protein